jgi:hypothetical protein
MLWGGPRQPELTKSGRPKWPRTPDEWSGGRGAELASRSPIEILKYRKVDFGAKFGAQLTEI